MIELIPLDAIESNQYQTRQAPDLAHIAGLAKDIQENGLLQTPVGRRLASGRVQLAFGHNRLSAYQMLHESTGDEKWAAMPVDLRDGLDNERMALLAWSENSARKDLSPVEQAGAIRQMMDAFGWDQERVAAKLGLARATVANKLRLLKLPADIRQANLEGKISERQASALLGLYEVAEPMLRQAEAFGAQETKPSAIVQAAKDGASSDEIRRRVELLVVNFTPKAQTRPVSSPAPVVSQPAWLPPVKPISGQQSVIGFEAQEKAREETPVVAAPAVEQEKPVVVASPAAMAPALDLTARPEEKLGWEAVTVQINITLMPGLDGDRPATISARAGVGWPVMRMAQEKDLDLSGPVGELVRQLKLGYGGQA